MVAQRLTHSCPLLGGTLEVSLVLVFGDPTHRGERNARHCAIPRATVSFKAPPRCSGRKALPQRCAVGDELLSQGVAVSGCEPCQALDTARIVQEVQKSVPHGS